MTRDELKRILKAEHEDESSAPQGASIAECAEAMLEYIGDTDPVLRDEYIREAFYRWTDKGLFTADEMKRLIFTALDDEHLLLGLGTEGEDSVFTRTFSALLIATLLFKNAESPFLTAEELDGIRRRFIEYYTAERDMRGYVEGYGWAHSAAHGSDVLEAIALSPDCTAEGAGEMLAALRAKLTRGSPVYIDGEPSRFTDAVSASLKRGLLIDEGLVAWLETILAVDSDIGYIEGWHRTMNVQNFFKALYFRLRKDGLAPAALAWLEDNIKA